MQPGHGGKMLTGQPVFPPSAGWCQTVTARFVARAPRQIVKAGCPTRNPDLLATPDRVARPLSGAASRLVAMGFE